MRSIFGAALTSLALCGCATDPSVYRQASLNCQAVGIGEKDPQFAPPAHKSMPGNISRTG